MYAIGTPVAVGVIGWCIMKNEKIDKGDIKEVVTGVNMMASGSLDNNLITKTTAIVGGALKTGKGLSGSSDMLMMEE